MCRCAPLLAMRRLVGLGLNIAEHGAIGDSQNGRGEITIGDSHEYGWAVDPFDKPEIDQLVLDYLQTFLAAPELQIAQRWHGVYAKHPDRADFIADPAPDVKIVNGVSGAGMTTAFGLAEEIFAEWE